jgi:hypothetical protein
MKRIVIIVVLSLLSFSSYGRDIIIQRSSENTPLIQIVEPENKAVTIALLSSPNVIGKYTQSLYNVSLATLLALRKNGFELKRYDLEDESSSSLSKALEQAKEEKVDAILAPLTAVGVMKLLSLSPEMNIFIPTVHKRDFPAASANITFGAIDYKGQIEALSPYIGDAVFIFYDTSSVGSQLKMVTEEVLESRKGDKLTMASFPVDTKGENIISYFSKPAKFNKSTIILHIPVVKSAILTSHLTFTGVKERNILSTQINFDPTLLTLTQYNDRKNMVVANSLIEFPSRIYESNALMNNDIAFDWIQYATSVGIDYLLSLHQNTPREYSMRLINSQIIYPIELMRPKEFGFEPLSF